MNVSSATKCPTPATRHVWSLVTAASVALSTQASSLADNSSKPVNFILIVADDLGYGDVSCYGDPGYQTPHIDRLAENGLRFTDFHSNGNVCSPTRAALLTGRYQHRAGIPGVLTARGHRHQGLQPQETTFAEMLQQAGYTTALFGKWHLGYAKKFNPLRQGFDEFRGYTSGNVDYFSHIDQTGVYDWWQGEERIEEPGYTTHLITRHALRFIEEHRDRPFCLYLPHEAPHSPYQGPQDSAERTVGGDFEIRGSRNDVKSAYCEMVQELDKSVGRVIETLERLDLDSRTFVLFFSDNGANRFGNNRPLRGTKGTNWEGGHRVPAIAWWPGRIHPGTTCRETVMTMDVLPTLLSLAGTGVSQEHRLDGVNLAPTIFDGQPLAERALFWNQGNRSAVRQGPWKLVVNAKSQDSPLGLYNLDDDVAEEHNLAEQHPERTAMMQNALARWQRDVASSATQQPTE